jgi:hypothetical protein
MSMKIYHGILIAFLSLLGAHSLHASDLVKIEHADYYGMPFLAVDTDDEFLGVGETAQILRGVQVCKFLGYAPEVVATKLEYRRARSTIWSIRDLNAVSIEREARRHGFGERSRLVPYAVFSSITCRRKDNGSTAQDDDGTKKRVDAAVREVATSMEISAETIRESD